MIELVGKGAYLYKGESIIGFEGEISREGLAHALKEKGEKDVDLDKLVNPEEAKKNTMSYDIIMKHNTSGDSENLKLKFDALTSHDLTFVGIIQTAKASGLSKFPIPYVLTNCHNSLCAVGGTINEDDHVFGLSAVKKYGGIYVPANVAVIHQYMREELASCGSMILGSDSHTRYGALGTMAIGEGGGELVKQLLSKTYDVPRPEVIAIYLDGKPRKGVGPQDIALAIIGAVFKKGFVKNKVMEFVGPGVSNLSVDYRNGIDVMTTETTCLSSIWTTDEKVKEFFEIHKRPEAYKKMNPGTVAYYDGLVRVDMSKVEPMIALPFHPSNVYTIAELNRNPVEIFKAVEEDAVKLLDNPKFKFNLTDKIVDGRIKVDQGIIAGCSGGTFENIYKAAKILKNASTGSDYFNMNVYPASQPVYLELLRNGALADLTEAGVIIKPAFCGPCFGAGDTPSNNALSIRHTTRNFPNREGSKPGVGQISSVALMDALSIAATALNGGYMTSATEIDFEDVEPAYNFDDKVYRNRVNQSFNKGDEATELKYGPSIADWPEMFALEENVLLKMVSVIHDPVTTTDELIPSGETSSYRSDPNKLSEFTLSRKDPKYVGRAKEARELERHRQAYVGGSDNVDISEVKAVLAQIIGKYNATAEAVDNLTKHTSVGSTIFAVKPGDGSAREQAASCQKVLGGLANISVEYATKRYRSNLINWGMIPFIIPQSEDLNFEVGDYIFVEGIKAKIKEGIEEMEAQVISSNGNRSIKLQLKNLTKDDKDIILAGSLINYYALSDN